MAVTLLFNVMLKPPSVWYWFAVIDVAQALLLVAVLVGVVHVPLGAVAAVR